MELQWRTIPCACLKSGIRQVQNQEQTLELRLTEGMPDIGRVICAGGQACLRGKQWRSDSIGISGGISLWVLYAPEDGSEPRCVEGWMPFQAKWPLPENHREGKILVQTLLRNLDARSLSARKLMVRGSVAIFAETYMPTEVLVTKPEELSDGIQVYRRTYPVRLCREAGEKAFYLEENLQMPQEPVRKILWCRIEPSVSEQTVAGSRVVMRGVAETHCAYMGEDDQIHCITERIPFAQFAELDDSFDKEATVSTVMAVSDLAWDLEEGQVKIKCNLVAQYLIHVPSLLELAEDAYSPMRAVRPTVSALELPLLLDDLLQPLEAEVEMPASAERILDSVFLPDYPVMYRENDQISLEIPGAFHALYYDREGNVQSAITEWTGRWQLPMKEDCGARIFLDGCHITSGATNGERVQLGGLVHMRIQTCTNQSFPMVTALEVGEPIAPDPERPSLILRRAGEMSLWELAKLCGSTVEAIENANQLCEDPLPDQMLLIPVM
jgi:hypothetical protein